MRRPLLVGTLTAAVIALVASSAFGLGTLGGRSSDPTGASSMMGGPRASTGAGMMGVGGLGASQGAGMMGVGGLGASQGAGMMGTGGPGASQGAGMMGTGGPGASMGAGMMGGSMMGLSGGMGMALLPGNGVAVSSIPAARARAAAAAKPGRLHPGEMIWFDNGFYVELKDSAGKAATEVIVDPRTGAVSTEPGPAMMWNTRSGMHTSGGAVGGSGTVDAVKARAIATAWLAANRAGTKIGSIDAYPGYFTVDLRRDGVVSGMMSVSSSTGAVWYHSWHGAFIAVEDR